MSDLAKDMAAKETNPKRKKELQQILKSVTGSGQNPARN